MSLPPVAGEELEEAQCWRHLEASEGYTELGMFAEAHAELQVALSADHFGRLGTPVPTQGQQPGKQRSYNDSFHF